MDNPDLAGHTMTQSFEKWRDAPYKDTKGYDTIGWGFKMDNPIVKKMLPGAMVKGKLDKAKAKEIFSALYQNAKNDAVSYLGNDSYSKLSEGQRNVINDMSYNLGLNKLSGFKKMKAALIAKDYAGAAREMKDSKWYGQVGNRSKNHILQIQE